MPGGAGHEECRPFYQSASPVQTANIAIAFRRRNCDAGALAPQLGALPVA
jgi:hypothetical protein